MVAVVERARPRLQVYTGPLYSTEPPGGAKHSGGWFFGLGRRRLRAVAAAAEAAAAEGALRAWAGAGLFGDGEGRAGAARRLLVRLASPHPSPPHCCCSRLTARPACASCRPPQDDEKKQAKVLRAEKSSGGGDFGGHVKSKPPKAAKPTKGEEKQDRFWSKMTNPFANPVKNVFGGGAPAPKVHAKELRAEKKLEKHGGVWAVEQKEKRQKKKLKLKKQLTEADVDPQEAKEARERRERERADWGCVRPEPARGCALAAEAPARPAAPRAADGRGGQV